jgi:hypothetical protein
VTYLLERLDRGTRITLRHSGFTSPESRTSTGVGWKKSFERLAEILATKHPRPALRTRWDGRTDTARALTFVSLLPARKCTMTAEPTPKGAWTITGLLFLYMLINFADKAVVGLAAVPIMQEFELTPRQFGLVGSSFFFLFSLSAVLVSFVANRLAAHFVILALALSWAVVQFPMVGAVGLATMLACRILLGAGEGPAFSVAVHALYKWFPDEKHCRLLSSPRVPLSA